MINKNFNKNYLFYISSFLIVGFLSCIIIQKMKSTYIAEKNFTILKTIATQFLFKKDIKLDDLNLYNNKDINITFDSHDLLITIKNIDNIACFKYGSEYMDSYFQSITFNNNVIKRTEILNREKILENCNKNYNIIILTEHRK